MSANADKLARNAKVHELHREMKTSVPELGGVTNEIRLLGIDPATAGGEMLAARERQARELGAGGGGGMAGGAGELDMPRAPVEDAAANGAAATTTRDVQRTRFPNGNAETDSRSEAGRRSELCRASAASRPSRLNPTKNDAGGGDGDFGARLSPTRGAARARAADAMSRTRRARSDRSVAERKAACRNQGVEVVRDGTET